MSGVNDRKLRIMAARLLKEVREGANLTQIELASRLGTHQSFVSKYEAAERKLDVVDLHAICRAMGTSLPSFARKLEARWEEES